MTDLEIDYQKKWYEMIAESDYSLMNKEIVEKNFPIPDHLKNKKVKITVKIITFDHRINSNQILIVMNKMGGRPITLPEYTFLSKKIQDHAMNVILGSIYLPGNFSAFVPVSCVNKDIKGLNLIWFNYDWPPGFKFPVVFED